MQPSFVKKLGLRICKTNRGAEKIDDSKLETYVIIITLFQVDNKVKKFYFFEKSSLLADISIDVAFEMSFLTLNNVEINFNDRELWWKSYSTTKALHITRQVDLVETRVFVTAALILDNKTFLVDIASLIISKIDDVYLF